MSIYILGGWVQSRRTHLIFVEIYKLKLKNSAQNDSFFYIVQYVTNISWICHFFIRFSRFLKKKRHQEQQLNHLDPCRAVSSFSSFQT